MKIRSVLICLAACSLALAVVIVPANTPATAAHSSIALLRASLFVSGDEPEADFPYLYLPDGEVPQAGLVPNAQDDVTSTDEDTSTKTNVTANDSTGDWPHSLAIETQPTHGDAVPNGKEYITYTPELNYFGTDSYVYWLCDKDGDCSSATVSITIAPVNDPPIAVDDSASTQVNTSVTIEVLTNDSDVENDSLLLQSFDSSSAQGGTVNRFDNGTPGDLGDDRVTYTPPLNFSGTDTFSYQVSDGSDSANAQVTVTVSGQANNPPLAGDDAYSIPLNNALTVSAPGVLVNDNDPDGDPLQAVLVTSPGNGTLTLNGDGSFAYTPATNFFGPDTFTYHASDGILNSNLATVTIEVLEDNIAPTAEDDSYSIFRNTTLEVAIPGVLGNDSDLNGDGLSAVLDDEPDNGTLTFNQDGSFTYTPDVDFMGVDIFRYRASDGAVESNKAQVTISVVEADTEAPSVVWLSPVADGGSITVNRDEIIPLEADASDNMGIASVRFYRWDARSESNVEIGIVYAAPYRWDLYASELNWGPNQVNVKAYDIYGNVSARSHIWVYKPWRVFMPVMGR